MNALSFSTSDEPNTTKPSVHLWTYVLESDRMKRVYNNALPAVMRKLYQ